MKPEASIVRERGSNVMYGTLTYGELEVRERIPIHVLKWEDERQEAYYRGVLLRLQRKLRVMSFGGTK